MLETAEIKFSRFLVVTIGYYTAQPARRPAVLYNFCYC